MPNAIKADHLPPGPWDYETTAPVGEHDGKGHVYLIDANKRKIASIWGPADTKVALVKMMIDAREQSSASFDDRSCHNCGRPGSCEKIQPIGPLPTDMNCSEWSPDRKGQDDG